MENIQMCLHAVTVAQRKMEQCSAAKIMDSISLDRFKELFLAEYKGLSGIDLASALLDSQAEYLCNRRRT